MKRSHVSSPGTVVHCSNRDSYAHGTRGTTIGGLKPRMLATVKTGTRHYRALFEAEVLKLGLSVVPVSEGGKDGWNAVYDVVGHAPDLAAFAASPVVVNYEYVANAHVAREHPKKPLVNHDNRYVAGRGGVYKAPSGGRMGGNTFKAGKWS